MAGRERVTALNLTYERESYNEAARTRRRRAGRPLLPVAIRNGLPFKPYVYQGVGYDIYSGLGDDDDA